jgi:hypothetical protein
MPAAGESLLGFAARLAARNGWDALPPFLNSLGLRVAAPSRLPFEEDAAGVIASAAGLQRDAVDDLRYRSAGSEAVFFLGHALPDWMVVTGMRRVCIACLKEQPFHRALWDCTLKTTCAGHAMFLRSACPSCQRDLGWQTTSVFHCACGFDLRTAEGTPLDASLAEASSFIDEIFGCSTASSLEAELPPLDTGNLLQLLLQLGQLGSETDIALRPTHMIQQADRLAEVVAIGVQGLLPWPCSFHALLERIAARKEQRPGRFGMRKALGPAASWIASLQESNPIGRVVLPEVRRHLDLQPCPEPTRMRLSYVTPGDRWITWTDAARRLGCSRARLEAALANAGVHLHKSGRGQPTLVPASTLEAIQVEAADLIGLRSLARELGVRRDRVCGVLEALDIRAETSAAAILTSTPTWSRKAVSDAIARRAEERASACSLPLLTFGKAAGRLVRLGLDWRAVCTALLGSAKPAALFGEGVGLRRLWYPKWEVEQLVPQGESFSVTEAAARIRVNAELGYLLVKFGLLRSELGPRGHAVTPEAIQTFLETYLLVGQLGLDHGHCRGWTSARLLAAGCKPVLGAAQGSRHMVFLRRDVESVLWQ